MSYRVPLRAVLVGLVAWSYIEAVGVAAFVHHQARPPRPAPQPPPVRVRLAFVLVWAATAVVSAALMAGIRWWNP